VAGIFYRISNIALVILFEMVDEKVQNEFVYLQQKAYLFA